MNVDIQTRHGDISANVIGAIGRGDPQFECDHKYAIREEKRNDEWSRKSLDSRQPVGGLRGIAVAPPSHSSEYSSTDVK